MACPICDQKPANCDCTPEEKRQYAEIGDLQDEIERLRITDAEQEVIKRTTETLRYLQADYGKTQTEQDAAVLDGLLERLGGGR